MFVVIAGPRAVEDDGTLKRMGDALRGGDGCSRLWIDPARQAGAASLKPWFVPEDAFDVQPMSNADRLFVCQARLDDRAELLERLGMPADAPLADSALLAAAYDRWGKECVEQVVGDYAFAAWHRRNGRVVAAVDPIGARRLLWARTGNGIALSAQLPALLAHPAVSREPDLTAMARLLDAGLDRTSTPYKAVRSLPGGHILTWEGGESGVRRWWRPDSEPTVWHRNPLAYVEEARALLGSAAAAQCRRATPLSSTLSGGLDSGAVTAILARLLTPARLTAYTAVPTEGVATSRRENWESDDSDYARQVAARYGNVDHRLVSPNGRSALDVAATVHRRSWAPTKSVTNLLWLDPIAAATAASGSRALFVAQQGNAAFSTSGHGSVWELARLGRLSSAFGQAKLEAKARRRSLPWVLAGAVRNALQTAFPRSHGSSLSNPGRRFITEGHRPSKMLRGNEYAEPAGSRAQWAAFITTPRHIWWPDPVLQWGIEFRDPTADRRLLERLLRFPKAAFRTNGMYRGLARELSAELLPDKVRLRTTHGAQAPEAPGLIAAHAARYRASIDAMRSSAACLELLDLTQLDLALDRFCEGWGDYHRAVQFDRACAAGLFLYDLGKPK